MSKTNWKALERRVAKYFNTHRVLQKGMPVGDVEVYGKFKTTDTPFCVILDCKAKQELHIPTAMVKVAGYCAVKHTADKIAVYGAICWRKNREKRVTVFLNTPDLLQILMLGYAAEDVAEYTVSMDLVDFKKLLQQQSILEGDS